MRFHDAFSSGSSVPYEPFNVWDTMLTFRVQGDSGVSLDLISSESSSVSKSESGKSGVAVCVMSAGDALLAKGTVLFCLRYACANQGLELLLITRDLRCTRVYYMIARR